jgi:hypothetical protein
MKKQISLAFLKLSFAAVIAIGLSAKPASAQSVTASFTLPYEVSWGKSTLKAGDYTITVDNPRRPALVRSLTGEGLALVVPMTVNKAIADQPTSLILSRTESGHGVRILNLREANVALGYGFVKPEPKIAHRPAEPTTVADLSQK